ncbi:hypothetical protein CK934_04815 [Chitinophaga sp. MD30]|nr:hypothetical protein CK934_04815 [Chitinophaga sp. MD30]
MREDLDRLPGMHTLNDFGKQCKKEYSQLISAGVLVWVRRMTFNCVEGMHFIVYTCACIKACMGEKDGFNVWRVCILLSTRVLV